MKISATVKNTVESHAVVPSTADHSQSLAVPLKAAGRGSAVNGGEFLMLAANNVQYRARIGSSASSAEIEHLIHETDAVAEVHNTLRAAVAVELVPWAEAQ